jgi:DNA-binding LacI/PurR family transcriptional regulator
MTIREVAELAGVSIATVSRVVNGHADVSVQTREAVRRVIREQGYQAGPRGWPGAAGTGLIGVTMPVVHPGYFAAILSGTAEALYEHDLRAVLCPTRHSRAREASLLERLAHGETDGAILGVVSAAHSSGAMQAARAAGLTVPAELSVVGFDDTAEPALTTVR